MAVTLPLVLGRQSFLNGSFGGVSSDLLPGGEARDLFCVADVRNPLPTGWMNGLQYLVSDALVLHEEITNGGFPSFDKKRLMAVIFDQRRRNKWHGPKFIRCVFLGSPSGNTNFHGLSILSWGRFFGKISGKIYSRGKIRILNLQRMREGSCECYEAVRSHYSALLKNKHLEA
jgi:hypothetical protein